MIPAVGQTLAEILAGNPSSIGTEQIDFDHPTVDRGIGPRLNLYCYEIRPTEERQSLTENKDKGSEQPEAIAWFDLSFLITAWDSTALGEQHLLSAALTQLLSHQWLPEELLPRALRGHVTLTIGISAIGLSHAIAFGFARFV